MLRRHACEGARSPDLETPTKMELDRALHGDMLAQSQLIRAYEKQPARR
jgi:hypothetical protein